VDDKFFLNTAYI